VTFSRGQTVVLQEVWRDRVWAARPMRVVRDDGDFVGGYTPPYAFSGQIKSVVIELEEARKGP